MFMRYFRLKAAIGILIFASFLDYGWAQYEPAREKDAETGNLTYRDKALDTKELGAVYKDKEDKPLPLLQANNKLCPADLKKIDPENKLQFIYEDKIYNFHSQDCIAEFEKDPKGYLEKWEKKERFRKINIIND